MRKTPITWAENEEPTAEQLADWLQQCTHSERVEFVERVKRFQEDSIACHTQNHKALEERNKALYKEIERLNRKLDIAYDYSEEL